MTNLTEEQCLSLMDAQLLHLRDQLNGKGIVGGPPTGAIHYETEDDGGDYLCSALDVAHSLFSAVFCGDYDAINQWLNMEPTPLDGGGQYVPPPAGPHGFVPLDQYAGDGLCQELQAYQDRQEQKSEN